MLAHARSDAEEDARIATEKALESQEKDVVTEFLSMTIFDKIALGVHSNPSLSAPRFIPKSEFRAERVEKGLRKIQQLECEFTALDVEKAISMLSTPRHRCDPFPLHGLKNSAICILRKVNSCNQDLEEVSSARVQLESRLETAISDLKVANHRWAESASKHVEKASSNGDYDTCKPAFSTVSQFAADASSVSPFLRT